MSDKLSDERREHLEFIERCDPAFLIMQLRNDTAFNADALESVFQLAKERARELLAASPAPTITMPPLNDAMRAVLTNENCIYGTPDELYAALVKAAPAISESEWQPIETAPASGKYLVKGGYLKVPGTNHWHWPKAAVRIQRVNHYFYVEDAVYNHPNGSGVSTLIYEPKHWKPLPCDEAIDAARKGEKS
ncbi:hypothetical protein DM48_318 [Burkholderia gladioli]|uniref:DUF551 domain-containing protein n=1 Tax=Burkholderia gladioli TaxID=28095 RepID=A0AAW3EYK3_BURGA|nr:hypothetical protein [Burkholderia gladioli]KGC13694.1 hypothetical protein DM48_318 [Burkholderia gladioli]